ncbi:peptidoglycan bridge formation glycyltransferase FemA/FemB family protein [Candidatus Saccharibacteria bacterium]|nr:peptidoglycan bridge formation glycyltransferase FemA/FemB family protein [Candidatus Saccharibacteria bacterium]
MEHKNFLQSKEFADWRRLSGDEVLEVAGNYMVVKSAKRGRYAEIAGALITDFKYFAKEVQRVGEEIGCIYVRVRPQLLATETNEQSMQAVGFKPAVRHLSAENTVILDLAKSEDSLLAEMRKQTRYEIRHLDRHPCLTVERMLASDNASIQAWDDFANLQVETAKRQGFVAPSHSELLNLREAFWDKAVLYIAKHNGEPIAYAIVIISHGEADYFEAASSEAARNIPAAYALQWQIIRDLKAGDVKYYNLYGIAPEGETNHRYSKLTTFKRGFGGEVVHYVHAHDLPLNNFKYRLLRLYELREKKRMKW